MMNTGPRGMSMNGAVVLATMVASNTAFAAVPAYCDVRLTVELTPDVPNPGRDGRVLSVHVNRGTS